MKKVFSMILAIVIILCLVTSAFAEDFDYKTVLGSRNGYRYDKFEKTWSYGQEYVEQFSDGRLVIGMRVDGEEGGSNPSFTQLYVALQDAKGDTYETIKSISILIGEDLYTYDSMADMDTFSAVILGEQGQLLIKALAECNETEVAVKVKGNRFTSNPLDLNSSNLRNTLKEFCRVYTKYNIWDYTEDRELSEGFEAMFPLTVNGTPAADLIKDGKAA